MAEVPERVKTRTQLVEEAITAALEADWESAYELNTAILERFGADEEVHNRLGKACTELGKVDEALNSYKATLEINPLNGIAIKNVNRLESLIQEKAAVPTSKGAVDVNLFVEEMGKSALAAVHAAPGFDPALVAPGDPVQLVAEGDVLRVTTTTGVPLGDVESKLARRVLKFMAGGNQYAGAVASIDGKGLRIIIRETFQAPEFAGQPSFPVRKSQEFRAYAKDSLLRDVEIDVGGDEDEEGGVDGDGDEDLDGMHPVDPNNEDAGDFGDEDTRAEDSY